jgi:hypothetical protein
LSCMQHILRVVQVQMKSENRDKFEAQSLTNFIVKNLPALDIWADQVAQVVERAGMVVDGGLLLVRSLILQAGGVLGRMCPRVHSRAIRQQNVKQQPHLRLSLGAAYLLHVCYPWMSAVEQAFILHWHTCMGVWAPFHSLAQLSQVGVPMVCALHLYVTEKKDTRKATTEAKRARKVL